MLATQFTAIVMACLVSSDVRVLFFTMQGCPPCHQMEPNIDQLARDGFEVSKIDARRQSDLAARFNVAQTPTTIIVDGSRVLNRHSGPLSYANLRQMVEVSKGRSAPPPPGMTRAAAAANQTKAPTTTASQQSQLTPEQLAMQATVRLRVEDAQGTSFATGTVIHKIENEALVLTCGHVFRDSQGQGVIRADLGFGTRQTKTVTGQLVHYDADHHDIALVAVPCDLPIQPVPVAPEGLVMETSDQVFSLGCDHGESPTVRSSALKAVSRYSGVKKYDIVGRPVDGRSGGGLFTLGGQLIGVCNAAAVEVDEGIYTGLDSIYWQLAKTRLTHLFNKRPEAPAAQAIAQRDEPRPRTDPNPRQSRPLARQLTEPAIADRPLTGNRMSPAAVTPVSTTTANLDDLEIILLVRSKSDPNDVRAIAVERPGQELRQLIGAPPQKPLGVPDRLASGPNMPDVDASQMLRAGQQMRGQSPR